MLSKSNLPRFYRFPLTTTSYYRTIGNNVDVEKQPPEMKTASCISSVNAPEDRIMKTASQSQLTLPGKWLGKNDQIKLLEMKRGHYSLIDPDTALQESVNFVMAKVTQLAPDEAIRLEWTRLFTDALIKKVAEVQAAPVLHVPFDKKAPQSATVQGWRKRA